MTTSITPRWPALTLHAHPRRTLFKRAKELLFNIGVHDLARDLYRVYGELDENEFETYLATLVNVESSAATA